MNESARNVRETSWSRITEKYAQDTQEPDQTSESSPSFPSHPQEGGGMGSLPIPVFDPLS